MKLLKATLAAILAVSCVGIGGAAMAQDMHHDGTARTHMQGDNNDHRGEVRHVSDDRGRHNGWNNNRRHHGWNNNRHRVCRTVWRHHHRQRVCNWVRR